MIRLLALLLVSAGLLPAKETGLVVRKDKKWPISNGEAEISVCWQQPGERIPILDEVTGADLGEHDVRFIKTAIAEAVESTWERYAAVNFHFREGTAGPCHVTVSLTENTRAEADVGYLKGASKVKMNPLHLRYFLDAQGTRTVIQRKNQPWVEARAQFAQEGTLNNILVNMAKWTAVHEFGHVIGLYHEHARKEAKAEGELETEVSRDQPGVKPIDQLQQPVAYYDRYSMMNYNNSTNGVKQVGNRWVFFRVDRDSVSAPNNPQLSCGDVIAARVLYPPTGAKANVAPCCTEAGYKAIMADTSLRRTPHLSYASFYQRNVSCFQQGGVRTGSGLVEDNCVNLAKSAAGADVCRSEIENINSVDPKGGTIVKKLCNADLVINGEVPNFESQVSLFMKGNLPYYLIKITVPNLQWVNLQELWHFRNFKVRRAGKRHFEVPPVGTLITRPGCGFDISMGLYGCTMEIPMGHGEFMKSRDCFCSLNSSPQEGDYVMYDPHEDTYLVDNSYVEFQFEYTVQSGQYYQYYKMLEGPPACVRGSREPWPTYSNLTGQVGVPLDIGDQFRVGNAWLTGSNQPPGRPTIPAVAVSDNGSGTLAVSWSPVSDPDGDPVYYFVEVKDVKGGSFKKYKAQQNTNLSINGLKRATDYLVRIISFDSRDRTYGEFTAVQTLDRPETCGQTNMRNVVLGNLPEGMLREELSLASRRVGAPDTYFWDSPDVFCSEHSANGLSFLDIPIAAGAVPSDWLYVETDKPVNVYLYYREGNGPESHTAPGLYLNNDYSYASGNFIKLGDYWGEGAKHFSLTQWRSAQTLTKVRITLKTNPEGRSTSRFGRALILKESPFGINYKGLRINDKLYSENSIRHPIYLGEPVEVELNIWTNNFNLGGNFLSAFHAIGGSGKRYGLKNPLALGDNIFTSTVTNMRYAFENQPLQIILEVQPNPYLSAILHPDGRIVTALAPNQEYWLNIGGLSKPMRSISLYFNGEQTRLSNSQHTYRFTTPPQLPLSNNLSLFIDGVECPVVNIKSWKIFPILMTLLQ